MYIKTIYRVYGFFQLLNTNMSYLPEKNAEYQVSLISTKKKSQNVKKYDNNKLKNEALITDILENDIETFAEKSMTKPWNKLEKMIKIMKLNEFADEYSIKNELNDVEKNELKKYLRDCLDKKRLNRVKDIQYDQEKNCILDIPSLSFHKRGNVRKFTLKQPDQKEGTLKNLAPSISSLKKKRIQIRKDSIDDDNNDTNNKE